MHDTFWHTFAVCFTVGNQAIANSYAFYKTFMAGYKFYMTGNWFFAIIKKSGVVYAKEQ
jgi:hypothetical protein